MWICDKDFSTLNPDVHSVNQQISESEPKNKGTDANLNIFNVTGISDPLLDVSLILSSIPDSSSSQGTRVFASSYAGTVDIRFLAQRSVSAADM